MRFVMAKLAVALAAALLVGGCADEEPPLSCPAVVDPGGNPVGIWEAVDFCYNTNLRDIEPLTGADRKLRCPDRHWLFEGLAAKGTIAIGADGRILDHMIITGSMRARAPLSCFAPPANVTSCELLGELLRAENVQDPERAPGDNTLITRRPFCKESGSDCDCAMIVIANSNGSLGTYTLPGPGRFKSSLDVATYTYRVTEKELRIQTDEALLRLLRR